MTPPYPFLDLGSLEGGKEHCWTAPFTNIHATGPGYTPYRLDCTAHTHKHTTTGPFSKTMIRQLQVCTVSCQNVHSCREILLAPRSAPAIACCVPLSVVDA